MTFYTCQQARLVSNLTKRRGDLLRGGSSGVGVPVKTNPGLFKLTLEGTQGCRWRAGELVLLASLSGCDFFAGCTRGIVAGLLTPGYFLAILRVAWGSLVFTWRGRGQNRFSAQLGTDGEKRKSGNREIGNGVFARRGGEIKITIKIKIMIRSFGARPPAWCYSRLASAGHHSIAISQPFGHPFFALAPVAFFRSPKVFAQYGAKSCSLPHG